MRPEAGDSIIALARNVEAEIDDEVEVDDEVEESGAETGTGSEADDSTTQE